MTWVLEQDFLLVFFFWFWNWAPVAGSGVSSAVPQTGGCATCSCIYNLWSRLTCKDHVASGLCGLGNLPKVAQLRLGSNPALLPLISEIQLLQLLPLPQSGIDEVSH